MVLRKWSTGGLGTLRVGEHQLRGVRDELIPHVLAADLVLLSGALQPHDTIQLGFGVCPTGFLDNLALDLVPVAIRVSLFVQGDRVALFQDDVGVTCRVGVDRWVHPDREDVLMVLSQYAWRDDVAVSGSLAFVDTHHTYDARRASLHCDAASSV